MIPTAHKEEFMHLYSEQGTTGFDFNGGDCNTCMTGDYYGDNTSFFLMTGDKHGK